MTREEKKQRRRWTVAMVLVCILLVFAWGVALWSVLGVTIATTEAAPPEKPSVAELDEPTFAEEPENELIENALLLRSEKIDNCKITHYCPCERCCGKWADGITASGKTAVSGITCAADDIPLGATVMVDYDGDGLIDQYLVCQDRFGGGETNHIDIFMDDHQAALNAGVKYATVWWCKEETE